MKGILFFIVLFSLVSCGGTNDSSSDLIETNSKDRLTQKILVDMEQEDQILIRSFQEAKDSGNYQKQEEWFIKITQLKKEKQQELENALEKKDQQRVIQLRKEMRIFRLIEG